MRIPGLPILPSRLGGRAAAAAEQARRSERFQLQLQRAIEQQAGALLHLAELVSLQLPGAIAFQSERYVLVLEARKVVPADAGDVPPPSNLVTG